MKNILSIAYNLIIFVLKITTIEPYFNGDNEILNVNAQQRVLLITIDGFRHDFISRYNLENFKKFQLNGASSLAMLPQFPSLTIPNYWSMVTGVNIERHGIIANNFYDPLMNRKFDEHDYSLDRLKLWSYYDPIWVDAVKKNIKTGVLFWPNFNEWIFNPLLKKNHIRTSRMLTFNEKIDITIDLFKTSGFQFCVINHNEPSLSGNRYGVDSYEFNMTIDDLDQSIGYLNKKLKNNGLSNTFDFNILIVSNQGISNIEQHVILDMYLKKSDADIWSENTSLFHLKPLIKISKLMKKLREIPGVRIYTKRNIPDKLKYKKSSRIGDVIIHAKEGVSILHMRKNLIKNGTNKRYNSRKKIIQSSIKAR